MSDPVIICSSVVTVISVVMICITVIQCSENKAKVLCKAIEHGVIPKETLGELIERIKPKAKQ